MVALVTPCSPSTTRRPLERFAFQGSTPALIRRELSHLTSRALDVLRLLARGLSNAEIAEQLTLSEATVKTHVARLLAKLQIRDRGPGSTARTRPGTSSASCVTAQPPAAAQRGHRLAPPAARHRPGRDHPPAGREPPPPRPARPPPRPPASTAPQQRARRIAMTPVTNPTLPAGELLEILRWLNPAASPRIAMGAGTPGTADGKAPGAELASTRVIPGAFAQAATRSSQGSAGLLDTASADSRAR